MHKTKYMHSHPCIEFASDPSQTVQDGLTELIAHTLVLHQCGVFKCVPAVQDLGVVGEGCDSSQGQNHMVGQQRRRPLTEPGDDGAIPTILRVTQYQNLLLIRIFT